LLPAQMQVILGPVQQSQLLDLHPYCIAARTTTNSSRERGSPLPFADQAITVAETIGRTRQFG
jgi:hypothetical protein